MSDNNNTFGFDDELLSNLEKLKKKYSALDEYEVNLQNSTDQEEKPADFKFNAKRKAKKDKPVKADYKFDSENPAETPAELN